MLLFLVFWLWLPLTPKSTRNFPPKIPKTYFTCYLRSGSSTHTQWCATCQRLTMAWKFFKVHLSKQESRERRKCSLFGFSGLNERFVVLAPSIGGNRRRFSELFTIKFTEKFKSFRIFTHLEIHQSFRFNLAALGRLREKKKKTKKIRKMFPPSESRNVSRLRNSNLTSASAVSLKDSASLSHAKNLERDTEFN